MPIRIDVYIHAADSHNDQVTSMLKGIQAALTRIEDNMASTVQDIISRLDTVTATVSATKDVADSTVVAIDGLNAEVADLKRQIQEGQITGLDEVVTRLDNINTAVDQTKQELANAVATIPGGTTNPNA